MAFAVPLVESPRPWLEPGGVGFLMPDVLPKLIVGLGNPGERYAQTRHNAGYMVVDRLISRLGSRVVREQKRGSICYRSSYAGRLLLAAQPTTYMNRSGDAVFRLINIFDLLPAEVLVVYDCLDLPLGRMRFRQSGGSGGQKGVESIIHALGTSDFPRLRVGIGRAEQTGVVDYVLSAWTAEEEPLAGEVLDAATDAVLYSFRRGITSAMNAFNGWEPQPTADNNEADK